MVIYREHKLATALFILGFLGVLSIAPMIPSLLALQPEPLPMNIGTLQAIAILQSSVLLALMVLLGMVFTPKTGLSAPVITAMLNRMPWADTFKAQLLPALIGGVAGGLLLVIFYSFSSGYLPPDFIRAGNAFAPPWYSRLLYGGITEEILLRWGVMSFLVWASYRITQAKDAAIKNYNFVGAIILSSLLFGLLHLPVAFALSPEINTFFIVYIVLGNATFGFIAGYLYWKWGLECAIVAHMLAHLTVIVLLAIT